jgi:class 3 adenylate cyclase
MESSGPTGLPHHRAIVALDIERSTSRTDPVKAELRRKIYELFDGALCSAGIHEQHRDRFIDRGDGVLALVYPVDQAPKVLLLSTAIPSLNQLLNDYNTGVPAVGRPERLLRIRAVVHAGEVNYDDNGCFGEALDLAFRLLDAAKVKRALKEAAGSMVLIVSEDIHRSVVRHGYDGINQSTFRQLVRVRVAGRRCPGWIQVPDNASRHHVAGLVSPDGRW